MDNLIREQLDRIEGEIKRNRDDIQYIKGFLEGRKFAARTLLGGGGMVGIIFAAVELMK